MSGCKVSVFQSSLSGLHCLFTLGHNGFGLAEGGEFEMRMLKFTIMLNRIPNAQPCNSAPLLANPCSSDTSGEQKK